MRAAWEGQWAQIRSDIEISEIEIAVTRRGGQTRAGTACLSSLGALVDLHSVCMAPGDAHWSCTHCHSHSPARHTQWPISALEIASRVVLRCTGFVGLVGRQDSSTRHSKHQHIRQAYRTALWDSPQHRPGRRTVSVPVRCTITAALLIVAACMLQP